MLEALPTDLETGKQLGKKERLGGSQDSWPLPPVAQFPVDLWGA